MIAVCTKCSKMFETNEEDACTPGVVCAECWRESEKQLRDMANFVFGGSPKSGESSARSRLTAG